MRGELPVPPSPPPRPMSQRLANEHGRRGYADGRTACQPRPLASANASRALYHEAAFLAADRRDLHLRNLPVLLGAPIRVHARERALPDAGRLLPQESDARELPWGTERVHLPARAHQLDDRRRLRDADLARDRLARRLRA